MNLFHSQAPRTLLYLLGHGDGRRIHGARHRLPGVLSSSIALRSLQALKLPELTFPIVRSRDYGPGAGPESRAHCRDRDKYVLFA